MAESGLMLALFNLGGGEIILILALVLIVVGGRRLLDLPPGMVRGILLFRKATKQASDAIDEEASEAGRSVGGIYGKPAAQALTPDNQVAEIYEPDVFETEDESRLSQNGVTRLFKQLWCWVLRFLLRREGAP